MTDPTNDPDKAPEPRKGAPLLRDVALLLLVGVALGVTHNAYMLAAGPGRGLPWVKTERRVVKLADLAPSDPPAGETAMDASATGTPEGASAPAPATPAGGTHSTPPKRAPGDWAAAPADSAVSPARAASANPGATPPGSGDRGTNGTTGGAAPAPAGTTGTVQAASAAAPVIPESTEPIEAGLDVVKRLYEAKAALFLDARSPEEFAEGHIAGAISLPFDEVFRDPSLPGRVNDQGRPIVCYCGGGDCDLSRNLAFSIIDAGRRRVLVLTGGLPEWQQAGLPVEAGAQR